MTLTKQLDMFNGTETYLKFNHFAPVLLTDGARYLAEKADCFWLFDIVASVWHLPEIKENVSFILWTIQKKGEGCIVRADTDSIGDGDMVYLQEIPYTDFPFKELGNEFSFYQCGEVIMLKGEY